MANRIGFFGLSKIMLKKANSVLTPKSPEAIEPSHPYGTDLNHTISFGESYSPITPGTDDWDHANARIQKHFGGKIGLQDLATAYHIPGMQQQTLSISPNYSGFNISYNGLPDRTDPKKSLLMSLGHYVIPGRNTKDGEDKHKVDWGGIFNNTDDKSFVPKFLKRVTPAYQKGNIKEIEVNAVGEGNNQIDPKTGKKKIEMNGNHAWATLGFGFADPEHLEETRLNALNEVAAHGNDPELLKAAESATHPFQFQDIARRLASTPANKQGGKYNSKQLFNKMTQRIMDQQSQLHYTLTHEVPEDNYDNGRFQGLLKVDPNDIGYQRLQKLVGTA